MFPTAADSNTGETFFALIESVLKVSDLAERREEGDSERGRERESKREGEREREAEKEGGRENRWHVQMINFHHTETITLGCYFVLDSVKDSTQKQSNHFSLLFTCYQGQ